MQITERSATFTTNNYRFGFNDMEQDNEVKGSGNSYDFGARVYIVRVNTSDVSYTNKLMITL